MGIFGCRADLIDRRFQTEEFFFVKISVFLTKLEGDLNDLIQRLQRSADRTGTENQLGQQEQAFSPEQQTVFLHCQDQFYGPEYFIETGSFGQQ